MNNKKIKLIAISVAMVLSTQIVLAEDLITDFGGLKDALKNATGSSATVKLGSDISATARITTLTDTPKSVTILGEGKKYTSNTLAFVVKPNTTLTLNNITLDTIQHGSSWGGAMYNEGTLNLDNVTFNNDIAVSTDPTTYNTLEYYKTFMNYLQAPMDCGIGYNKALPCFYMRDYSSKDYKPYKTYDGKTNASMILFDDGQIALQDGTLLLFENYAPRMRVFVSVDLNGYNNKPNRWGYDLFTFQLVDNQLKAMGDTGTTYTDLSTYCNVNSQDEYNGIACAKKALSDSEYFKNIVKEFK